ncbi:MAG TPA: leucyl aminopeptidase [Bacteroidia bacterium]|nr:leucyl aminopeptidase [Bacteroidia bacterium]
MNVSIKKATTYNRRDHVVFLTGNVRQLTASQLGKKEIDYVRAEFKNKNKTVVINQYNRMACVVNISPDKKEAHNLIEAYRKAGCDVLARFNKAKAKQVVVVSFLGKPGLSLAFAEGMALGNYQFLRYKKGASKERNSVRTILIQDDSVLKRDAELLQISTNAVYNARNLVNEPQSYLTAEVLASEFVHLGKEAGFSVTVFDKEKITELKMGGLLAVNKGSIQPPTFTVMEWKPENAKNKKPIVLVGKGVVYDTGGLSLKPTLSSMDYMKCDMAGSAAVGCAMYAVAKAKLPLHVIALAPSTDNRPDGNAYAPGDVITMYDKTTVEVLNTDAEGRMILADALAYAKQFKPQLVLDFATLTGAASAAVGPYGMVCMGKTDKATVDELKQSGDAVYERLAEFPFWEEYSELIKSDIADLKNVGGSSAGAITAGKFLQHFTDYPWFHFDIAGVGFLHKPDSYRGKNGSGYGVRFIFDYLKKISQ